MRGIHRWPVNSPQTWQVTRKMFPFDDFIMKLWDNWYHSNSISLSYSLCLSLYIQSPLAKSPLHKVSCAVGKLIIKTTSYLMKSSREHMYPNHTASLTLGKLSAYYYVLEYNRVDDISMLLLNVKHYLHLWKYYGNVSISSWTTNSMIP